MPRSVLAALRAVATHRLPQFLVGGALLLAAAPAARDSHHIALDGDRLQARIDEAARREHRRVDAALRDEVLSQVVTDELLVREARRLGLDQDDAILRRRLIQKALFLAEDLGGASRPIAEAELRTYFEQHRAEYWQPARARLRHVTSTDRDELARLAARADAGAGALRDERARVLDEDEPHLRRTLGPELTAALPVLPRGRWCGPLRSGLGHHLVYVEDHAPARPARFEEVADRLRLDVLIARRQLAVARFVDAARAQYRVTLDGAPLTPPPPAPRTAAHYAPSVED